MRRETKYARSGGVSIAYQVIGDGPLDLVYVSGWVSHLDYIWEQPEWARFMRRLASFSRLIRFDKRGVGLSDRTAGLPTLEERMDDVRAVMDAVGSDRAALCGVSEGAPMCALFAATFPARTIALIMVGGFARRLAAPDYPWGYTPAEYEAVLKQIEQDWGGPMLEALALRAPSRLHDEQYRAWWATYLRMSASPGAALALTRMNAQVDIRHVLPAIRVPTLVVHRTGDRALPVGHGRYLAGHIPGARYVELPGDDHLPYVSDQDAILDEIEFFLTGVRPTPPAEPTLKTVSVIEIVDATQTALHLGPERWEQRLAAYRAAVQDEVARHRGSLFAAPEAGVLATYDGPARAVRCAGAIVAEAKRLGIDARVGLHTGPCALDGDRVAGIAVRIAAGVAAQARPGEVVVSGTVKDLTPGSGLSFRQVGVQASSGLPSDQRLFLVVDQPSAVGPPHPQPLTTPATSSPDNRTEHPLTPAELRVARLVARGLTNREVADTLFIAPGTVESHLTRIRAKLGVHRRAEIAAWLVEHGLLDNPPGS